MNLTVNLYKINKTLKHLVFGAQKFVVSENRRFSRKFLNEIKIILMIVTSIIKLS